MSESALRGVVPEPTTGLRDLMTAWLPQGFAKIVQPIASTVISTDDKGLVAGEVNLTCYLLCFLSNHYRLIGCSLIVFQKTADL